MQTDESVQKVCRLHRSLALFYISVAIVTSPPEYSLGMVHGRATKDCHLIPRDYTIHNKNDRSKFSFFSGNTISHISHARKLSLTPLFAGSHMLDHIISKT